MAATVKNKKLYGSGEEGALVVSEITVTFAGVTSYTWMTGLRKVLGAGVKFNGLAAGGTGGGSVTPNTTTDGQVDIASFTSGDVQTFVAVGYL